MSSDPNCLVNIVKTHINPRRWIFLLAYAVYTAAWLCYFRHFWFCEGTKPKDNYRVAIMWLARFLVTIYSPFLIHQTVGFVSFFPNWATYDSEEPKRLEGKIPPLVFRVVSRGDDPQVLQRGVEFHSAILQQLGVTDWLYQLVVERPNDLATDKVEVVLVPKNYVTPKKTLFKARNLQYAVSHPTAKYNKLVATYKHLYLVHLDEETLVTAEAMRNCLELSRANKYRCGHGMITCGWHKVASPLATFTDSWRISLDAGLIYSTFRLQHRCHVIKGGFFLLRNDLEEEIGWDFGQNVIQEDFHLGRLLDHKEEPVEFIEGVVMEESPVDVIGLIRQRSRWLVGIFRDLFCSDQHFNGALATASFLSFWLTAPLIVFVLILGVFIGPLDTYHPILDDFITIMMATMPFQYFYGVQLNFRLPTAQRLALTLANLTFIPIVAGILVECCGVFHAVYTLANMQPNKGPNFTHTHKAVVRRTASNKLR